MEKISSVPVIGVVADHGQYGGQPSQNVKDKYLDALTAAGAAPIILPQGLGQDPAQLAAVMALLDGVFLTGSTSNVEPHHYLDAARGEDVSPEPRADPGRDRLSFALIDHALEHRVPLLAVCRGVQELVVRTGGKLYRRLWEVDGLREHREDSSAAVDEQYAPAHSISLVKAGVLAGLFPDADEYRVNSLHGQGIAQPGSRLQVEAVAEDGLIETVAVKDHPFALGVQWHPEWKSRENPLSRALFDTLIEHARRYRQGDTE